MGRYLKSVSMKTDDGTLFKIPTCFIECQKEVCRHDCAKYTAATNDIECSHLEMEFGWKDGLWELFLRNLLYLIVIIVFFAAAFLYVFGRLTNECSFSVETNAYTNLSAAEYRVTCKGRSIDANCFLQAVSNVLKKAGLK